ncbi:OmpH family outer membrane protein [Pseudogemmobacter sp. W21_MBD1_M6]|uniref:OmpH family outer membrane protein n=1 Tax=Pseudogemmobacter sp. W21_MBD1_M6 TaxID=3240271 RepID=UPI003F99918E
MRAGITKAVAFCVTAFFATAGLAQTTQSVPFLTLDQDLVFSTSLYGLRVTTELEQEAIALAAENRKIEADLTREERELTEKRPGLSADAFRTLADAFDQKVQGIRTAQDAKSRDLGRRRDEERQQFFNRALPMLANLVRERGAVAILDKRAIFLAAEAIDITDAAIARINAELGDGTTIAPQPQSVDPDAPVPVPPAPRP